MSKKIEKLASDIKKLSPAGQELVGMVLDLSEETKTIDTIRACAREIDATEQSIKTAREMAKEIVEGLLENEDVIEAKGVLEMKQEVLKAALLRNAKYNDLMERLAGLNEQLKDDKEVLSNALLLHYKQTGERQVEVNDHMAREVLLTGKLGKEQKYQTSLFKGKVTVEIGG